MGHPVLDKFLVFRKL